MLHKNVILYVFRSLRRACCLALPSVVAIFITSDSSRLIMSPDNQLEWIRSHTVDLSHYQCCIKSHPLSTCSTGYTFSFANCTLSPFEVRCAACEHGSIFANNLTFIWLQVGPYTSDVVCIIEHGSTPLSHTSL